MDEPIMTVFYGNEYGPVRTVTLDGEPWFCAQDICRELGIITCGKALGAVPDEHKRVLSLRFCPHKTFVSEEGLEVLANDPTARTGVHITSFFSFLAHRVIPAASER
jgi:prophage antirepressor-like protein